MPLPNPILDDRSYQQLRDELVRRIPVYAPDWTDYSESDPGVTLLELFAFLGEHLLFRFNQIPEQTKLAFLRLLQIPMRPAVPARALVAMTADDPAGTLVEAGAEARAGSVSFETRTEVVVWPVSVLAVGRIQASGPAETETELQAAADRVLDAIELDDASRAAYYQPATVATDGSGPAVNFGATVDGTMWVAVLGERTADTTKLAGRVLNLGFVPDPILPKIEDVVRCLGPVTEPATPAVEWQISAGGYDSAGEPVYTTLSVVGDTTRGLTEEGVVRLRLPRQAGQFGTFTLKDKDLAGTGNLPPTLDEKTEAKVLFWVRAFRRDGSRLGSVTYVGANAAEATQTIKAAAEYLGTGNGQPGQTGQLVHRPVVDGSVFLEVEETSGWKRWTQVDGLHVSGPDDRHYTVNLEAGEVRFGDGAHGLPPQIGQRIRVVEYRYGGGADGNVAANAISKLPGYASVKLGNPLRARGGADAEAVDAALERIPAELRRRDRAVTASDFQELAFATPGAEVGRAECLPRFHPKTKSDKAAGVVTVVIWPREDARSPNAPAPDKSLLKRVCDWLDDRRLITTELYVVPPTYRKVAVSVGLEVKPGYGVEAVSRWVELVIRQYLAPLPPYGPAGKGYPLGRRVYGPELEAAALQVEGVEYLNGLNVAGWDAVNKVWKKGTVELDDWEVPELANITVLTGQPLADPDQGIDPPEPTGTPVPVPVLREEC